MAKTMQIRSADGSMEVYYTGGVPKGGTGPVMARLGPSADGEGDSRLEIFYKNGQTMARLGELPGTGRVGMEICDESGNVKVLAGELTDGDYGLGLVDASGTLVKLEDFIFGPKKAEKSTPGTTTSTSYTNLSDGAGPTLSGVTIGELGRAIVTLTAYMEAPNGGMALMGVLIEKSDGSFAIAPDDLDSLSVGGGSTGTSTRVVGRSSVEIFVEGLYPGTYTFTAKYRVNPPSGSPSALFANRVIKVQPY
ncbi:hypothetical protein [Micromonospora sp. NPDC093244]|uniref:hypothetical protein n=1 Tax=Micromonospora sp. NPDC093244 TaxID=3155071 RepID=UPI00342D113A